MLYISNISGTAATWVKQEASGGGKIQDVQVNGTTIVDSGSGIANLTGTNLPSHTLSKISDVTASAAEINVLDGITATTTELNYTDGVTGNIQTQLDGKQPTISSSSKLSADLIDDSGATNKFVTEAQKTAWTNKQDALPSTSSHEGEFLHANEDTGVLEWDTPEKGEYASFDTNKLHFTEEPVEPAETQKTITGLFPLTWQDGIGGDLVDYSISGKTELSGVKNQLVQNGNFVDTSYWSMPNGSLTAVNNVGIYTLGEEVTTSSRIQTNVNIVGGHKYFSTITLKSSGRTYISYRDNQNSEYFNTLLNANVRKTFEFIQDRPLSATILYLYINDNGDLNTGDTVEYENIQLIDLTAMFGAGNEPTTTAEAKQLIARVMNHGTPLDYYPYDAGTPYSIGVGDYGGKRNQLVNLPNTYTSLGVTQTFNNGVVTLSGVSTDSWAYSTATIDYVEGHKYYVGFNVLSNPNSLYFAVGSLNNNVVSNTDYGSRIVDCDQTVHAYLGIMYFSAGTDFNGVSFNFITIDLTEMFGSGSEPTDVSTAKQRIAEVMGGQQEYYPYDSGTDYYKLPVVVTDQNRFGYDNIDLRGLVKDGDIFTSTTTDILDHFNFDVMTYNDSSFVETVVSLDITKKGRYVTPMSITTQDYTSIFVGHNGSNANMRFFTFTKVPNGQYYFMFDVFSCDPTTVGGLVFGNIKIVTYEQLKTIYRTTQLTANQTIRKTTDGLPNFTNLPTGYLQMGVDTEVQPSAGSVTYLTGTVTNYDLTQVKFSDDTTKNIADHRLPSTLGTANQVLKMNSAGTAIEWGSGGSGGGDVADVKVNGTSVVDANKVAQVTVPVFVETTLDDYLENEATYSLTNNIYFVGGSELTDVSTEAR